MLPKSAKAIDRIYISPDDHTDFFWTADENQYKQVFLNTLDTYLNLADETQGNQSEYQSRFSADGSFWMWTYEKNRSPLEFQRLIDRVKSGHLSIPMNSLAVLYGGQPTEAVLRGMYYSGQIERKYDVDFDLAYSMENSTQPFGLGSLWAGSGVKYSWKGVCGCATRVTGLNNRDNEIYWWEGFDGSKILTKWNTLFSTNTSIGGYAESRNIANSINFVSNDFNFNSKYPYETIGVFGYGWDDLQITESTMRNYISTASGMSNGQRQVIVSNEEDFFKDFEINYGDEIPTKQVSFGNEWETDASAFTEITARVRRSVEKLRSVESLATLVSLKNANILNNRNESRDLAWMNIGLFWEHDLAAGNTNFVSQRIAWQRRLAGEIESYVETLFDDAKIALGEQISRSGNNQRFFVFNSLSWVRSDVADFPYSGTNTIHIVEVGSNVEVPFQIMNKDGVNFIRILASEIPPIGYKVYEIRSGLGESFPPVAVVSGNVVENDYYRVLLTPRGAIESLIDKTQGNLEYAQNIDGRYINDLGPSTGTLTVENSGPVSVTLKADALLPLNHTTRITFVRDSKKIIINNQIQQGFDATHTYSYAFNLSNPTVRHEELGSVLTAKLVNDGGNYSTSNARYDWLTMNHFVDMSSNSSGVTISNSDVSFFKLGRSTSNVLDTDTPLIQPVVGGKLSYSRISNQAGDTQFIQRFALQTHGGFNQVSAMKFSLEVQNPFVVSAVTGTMSVYPENTFKFLEITSPDVLLWALKPSEEGIDQGVIARFWNLANTNINTLVTLPNSSIDAAFNTSHIETNLSPLVHTDNSINLNFNSQQLKTVRLNLNGSLLTATPTIPRVLGDANGDGFVDGIDYVVWLNHYNQAATPNDFSVGNFNNDTIIDGLDYVIWLNNYSG